MKRIIASSKALLSILRPAHSKIVLRIMAKIKIIKADSTYSVLVILTKKKLVLGSKNEWIKDS